MPLGAVVLSFSALAFTPSTPEHALARWVTSQGGFVGSVAAETRGGLRGLYVTEPVGAGELLVSVPRACCISSTEDPQFGLSLRELLTARLCGALSRGEYEPYTQTLPEAEPLLCDWSEVELEQLQSPWLADLARGMPRFLAESNARVQPFVQAEPPTALWAERMVRSRALLFERSGYAPTMSLVPIIDLANHHTPPRRAAGSAAAVAPVSDDADAITLCAPTDLAAGEQVLN